jgi:hypothetical protein
VREEGAGTVLDKVAAELVQLAAAVDVEVADADERQLRAVGQPLEVIRKGIGWGGEGEEEEEGG